MIKRKKIEKEMNEKIPFKKEDGYNGIKMILDKIPYDTFLKMLLKVLDPEKPNDNGYFFPLGDPLVMSLQQNFLNNYEDSDEEEQGIDLQVYELNNKESHELLSFLHDTIIVKIGEAIFPVKRNETGFTMDEDHEPYIKDSHIKPYDIYDFSDVYNNIIFDTYVCNSVLIVMKKKKINFIIFKRIHVLYSYQTKQDQ
jgi:hypothetical protein